jgi:hypothetical protein
LQPSSLSYKLIRKVKDERFDEEFIQHYHLLINLGTRDFQLMVIDPRENRVILLEDFVLPNLASHEELLQMLDVLFDSHPLLKANFWKKIKIAFKNQKFVQVPQALYAPEYQADYLKYNAPVDPQKETFLSATNTQADAVTVFAVNTDLINWLSSVYPNNPPEFTHQSAALIEGVLKIAPKHKDNPLYIYVDRFKLHILACTANDKLLYYNQFTIKQFSDYVKYIMLVLQSLGMDQKTSRVILWGYIGNNSPHYHEFYKYIGNVVFGERPDYLKFNFAFDELQDHHFFDLFSIYLD